MNAPILVQEPGGSIHLFIHHTVSTHHPTTISMKLPTRRLAFSRRIPGSLGLHDSHLEPQQQSGSWRSFFLPSSCRRAHTPSPPSLVRVHPSNLRSSVPQNVHSTLSRVRRRGVLVAPISRVTSCALPTNKRGLYEFPVHLSAV